MIKLPRHKRFDFVPRHFNEEKEYNAPTFEFLKESIEKTLIFKFTDHLTGEITDFFGSFEFLYNSLIQGR